MSAALARRLLATSSLVSLIAGAGGAAQAACYTGPFGFTNNSNLSCVNVTNTSFTGSITNTGTISPGGINLTSATITGQIVDTGTIAGGITLDSHSSIIASGPAININSTSSFGGGITNNGGTIHSSSTGIAIGGGGAVSTFSGNIVNSGSITGSGPGILITSVSSFLGGITNNGGTIGSDGGSAPGILISNVSSFSGGIAINGGSVTGQDAPGISIVNVSNFSNGIFNSGTITGNPCCGAGTGVLIQQVSTFSGGVTNTGTIQGSCGAGLRINTVSQFNGNIFNGGTISGAICCNAAGIGVLIQGVSTFTGNVTNTGKITGNCGDGLRIVNVTKLVGNISNGGTISGRSGNGITLGISTFQGQIINTGLISGQVGIYLSGEGVGSTSNVSIFNSGTITGTAGPTPTAIEFGGGTNTLTLGPGYVFNGIVVGTGHDIFQLGGSGNGTLNLGLINSTSQFRGFNTFNVVSGNWTAFGTFSNCCAEGANGPWMVLQGGTLNVVGDLSQASSLTVNSGGKVMGYGFLPNTTILDGGTLAPGGPLFELGASNPGDGVGAPVPSLVLPNTNVLTIQGNLSMGSAANYLVQVYSTTSTKTIVTGTANIGGYLIANAAGGPYTLGQTYTVMTDTNGIHGTFSLLETTGNFGPYRPVITYDADDVFLTMQYAIFAPLLPSNATINERNTAQALDAFVLGGGALPPGFSNIFNFTPQQILNALNQLTGEVGTGAQQTSFQLMNEFMDLLFGAPGGPGGGGGMMSFAPARQDFPDDVALAYASVLKAPPALARSPLSVWAASYGGANRTDGDPIVMGSADLTAKTFGTAVGLEDQISPDTKIGVALAGAGGGWTLSGGLGSGTSNAVQGGHLRGAAARAGLCVRRADGCKLLDDHHPQREHAGLAGRHAEGEFCGAEPGRTARGWLPAAERDGIWDHSVCGRAGAGLLDAGLCGGRVARSGRSVCAELRVARGDRDAQRAWQPV